MVKAQVVQKPKKSKRSSVGKRDILKKKILNKKPLTKKKEGLGLSKKVWGKAKTDKGVVYLSHIPHGFYEEQIENYFSQFGKVTELSVPRSKTGRAKGYAFVQFLHPEVAKIAADAMNNYLMFNRVLKAKYIPPEEQKERLFKQAKITKETNTTRSETTVLKLKQQRTMKNRMLHTRGEAKLARKLLKKCQLTKDKMMELEEEPLLQINNGNVADVLRREKVLIEKRKKAEKTKRAEKRKSVKKETEETLDKTNESLKSETKSSYKKPTGKGALSKHKNKTKIQSLKSKEITKIIKDKQDLVKNQGRETSPKSKTKTVQTKSNKMKSRKT